MNYSACIFFTWVLNICTMTSSFAQMEITGNNLTPSAVHAIAINRLKIDVAESAWGRVEGSHQAVLTAARNGQLIYGLNLGVGLNKDRKIFDSKNLTEEGKEASEKFNLDLLRSHSIARGRVCSVEVVRAAMVVRLNCILNGSTGCHPYCAEYLHQFINRGIHPLIRSSGSVGESDNTVLPAIGLAMAGEGKVEYQGKICDALEALKNEGLKPLKPYAKDALSILSSNAYSAGRACITLVETKTALQASIRVYALSLEGLNGNLAPLAASVHKVRPFSENEHMAAHIRKILKKSYLYQPSSNRAHQDPLSFRDAVQIFGMAKRKLKEANSQLSIQINSSDDNPSVLFVEKDEIDDEIKRYASGAPTGSLLKIVVPTSNFEPISWTVDIESLSIGLAHVSRASANRILRMGDPKITGLSRFLAVSENQQGFGTVPNLVAAIQTEIRALATPVSLDGMVVAGGIEDVSTNAPLAVQRLRGIVDKLNILTGIELVVATQAIDLRNKDNNIVLGTHTKKLYKMFRDEVKIYDGQTALSHHFDKAEKFVERFSWSIKDTR